MSRQITDSDKKPPIPLWQAIALIIALVFLLVFLFGVIVYVFIAGVVQLGYPSFVNIAVFVILSGIFAWLIKRITDIVSGMSTLWFPEQFDDE